MHYTIFCCIIWGVTIAVNVIVSLCDKKPNYDDYDKYTIKWGDLIPRW